MSKRKTYSREYKIGAIQMVEQKGMTTREASEALGINEGMLRRWRKEYKKGKIQAFPGNGKMSDKDAEIAKLRQENRRLLAKREILKKATVLFARPM
ncbi:MAG: transposase [Gemmataceae bacterium]